MYEKHCRYCNAKIGDNRGWLGNYCCEDHRVLFQARQHRETVERLRREEQAESELALHSFEPRRVRISMLGGDATGPMPPNPGTSAGPGAYVSRSMPAPVNVQPLVAPPLQPKASVEQSLAALSFVAEPVSMPLEIPAAYTSAPLTTETLGAAVRRPAPADVRPAAPLQNKNDAIVNLIRGAKERMVQPAAEPIATPLASAPAALGVPKRKPAPGPAPDADPQDKPGNGARVRSTGTVAPPQHSAVNSSATTTTPNRAAQPTNSSSQVPSFVPVPRFLSSEAASPAPSEGWRRIGVFAIAGCMLLAAILAYFLFAGR